MTAETLTLITEDELDVLVSIAIRRAELLDDVGSPAAGDAWDEVGFYEQRLADITPPHDVAGGVSRVGAVRAALAAGKRQSARMLAQGYLAQESLPAERRAAIEQAFSADQARLAEWYPALAKRGRLAELEAMRAAASGTSSVFPRAA